MTASHQAFLLLRRRCIRRKSSQCDARGHLRGAAKVGEIGGAAAEWAAGDFLANDIKFPRHSQSISNGPNIDDFLRNESKDFFEPDTVVRPFETDDAVSILLFLVSESSCGQPAPDSAISSDRVGVRMDRLSSEFLEVRGGR